MREKKRMNDRAENRAGSGSTAPKNFRGKLRFQQFGFIEKAGQAAVNSSSRKGGIFSGARYFFNRISQHAIINDH